MNIFIKLYKYIFLFILVLLIDQKEIIAQVTLAPDFIWTKNAGGTGYDGSTDAAVDNLGDIIVTGYFDSTITFGSFQLTSSGSSDIFIAKFNSDGDVIWAKKAGGSEYDQVYSVAIDDFNNIIITGTFSGRAVFDSILISQNGNTDAFIAKYSSDGSILWAKNYGGQGYEYGYHVSVDNLNNIITTGVSQNFGAFILPYIIFLVKYDAQGNSQWEKIISGYSINNIGLGTAANTLNDVFLVGSFGDTANFSGTIVTADPGGDIFLAKYSEKGTFNWVRQAGFNNNNDQAGDIVIDINDDIYITGHFRGSASFGNINLTSIGSTDLFLAKYNQLGNPAWVKQDSLLNDNFGTGLSLDAAGNISVIGYSISPSSENSSILIGRFNKEGEKLWNKTVGTSSTYVYPGGIENDKNGDIIISGSYYNVTSQDIIVGKLPSPKLSFNTQVDFGIVEAGSNSAQALSFSNTSNANLFLFNFRLSGFDSLDFEILTSIPEIIPAQQTIDIDFEFSPLNEGLRNTFLIIESDAPTSPDTLFLTGTAVLPSLTISTDTLNFGVINIDDSSDLDLEISNRNSVDIVINELQILGDDQNEFSIINTAVPDTITSEGSKNIIIRFSPKASGIKSSSLIIVSNSSNSPDTISLIGTGRIPPLIFSSEILDFGSIDVNNFSEQTFNITNPSSADIVISGAIFSGLDQNEFSLMNTLIPDTIDPLSFKNFIIRFTPEVSGIKQASLIISSSSSSSPDSVVLMGRGISSISVSFGDSVNLGESSSLNITPPSGFNFTNNQFFYRRTGETIYQQTSLILSGSSYIVDIPAEFSTIRGIQFYIVFSDGTNTVTFPTNNPISSPASIQVKVPQFLYSQVIQKAAYQMISIPLSLTNPSINSVLEDDYGFYDNRFWRLFKWEQNINNYLEYPNLNNNLTPGNAFWLINIDGKQFDIEDAVTVQSNNPYTITLQNGWNQIGNPFSFPVDWDSIDNASLVQAPIYFNPDIQAIEINQHVLQPWVGYWVFNPEETINLNIPPIVSSTLGKRNLWEEMSSHEFILQIKANLISSNIQDLENFVGMIEKASNSTDKYDVLEPPPITNDLKLSIVNDGKEYAQNIAAVSKEGAYWNLQITSRSINKTVQLIFNIKSQLPEEFKIWLLDIYKQFSNPIINDKAEIKIPDNGIVNLRLIIGKEDYAKKYAENIPLVPVDYILFQNYPNPFNPATNISYQLKERSNVTLEVYDILGVKVVSLIDNEIQNAGQHIKEWDGTNLYGDGAASGIYFYRIKADNFISTKKMILLR